MFSHLDQIDRAELRCVIEDKLCRLRREKLNRIYVDSNSTLICDTIRFYEDMLRRLAAE